MTDRTHIRSGLISLIVPAAYILIFLLAGALGLSIDQSEAAYMVFIGMASIMLVLFPLVLLVCGIVGNVHGSLALREQEPKKKSILVLAFSILYTLGAVAIAIALWIGLSQ